MFLDSYRLTGTRYDPTADTWTPIPTSPVLSYRGPVWTGSDLVGYLDRSDTSRLVGVDLGP